MSETVKEKIKRKKKEQAKMNNNNEAPSKADEANAPIELLGIYPSSQPKKKHIAQGHVCIKMHQLGLEVRNIPYGISKDRGVKIQPPFKYHSFPDEPGKPHKYVESIAFDDVSLWGNACELIKAVVLEHHKEDLLKAEQEKPESPDKVESPAKVDVTSDSTKE